MLHIHKGLVLGPSADTKNPWFWMWQFKALFLDCVVKAHVSIPWSCTPHDQLHTVHSVSMHILVHFFSQVKILLSFDCTKLSESSLHQRWEPCSEVRLQALTIGLGELCNHRAPSLTCKNIVTWYAFVLGAICHNMWSAHWIGGRQLTLNREHEPEEVGRGSLPSAAPAFVDFSFFHWVECELSNQKL